MSQGLASWFAEVGRDDSDVRVPLAAHSLGAIVSSHFTAQVRPPDVMGCDGMPQFTLDRTPT